jgi:hypothetical protein
MAKIINNDTGSLKVGSSLGKLAVGQKLQLVGEQKVRTITYVMGEGEKQHVCAKGTGPFPIGDVEVELVVE